MARLGMDVDVVESVGKQLNSQSQSVTSLIKTVDRLVASADAHWYGTRGREFVNAWRNVHRPALVAAASAAEGLGRSALQNASAQRKASETGGPASSSATRALGIPGAASPAPGQGSMVSGLAKEYALTVEDANSLLNSIGYDKAKMLLDYLDEVKEQPLAGKIVNYGPLKGLNIGLDIASWGADAAIIMDESRSFEDRFFASTDAVSRGLGYLGPVGVLGSIAIDTATIASHAAMETDWSREGFEVAASYLVGGGEVDLSEAGIKSTLEYAVSNPGETWSEVRAAIPEVPGVLGRAIGLPW